MPASRISVGFLGFRLDAALGRAIWPPGAKLAPKQARAKRGQDQRGRVCTSPGELRLVNPTHLVKTNKKNNNASKFRIKLKK